MVEDELEQQVDHAGKARGLRLFQENTPSGNEWCFSFLAII